MREVLLQQTTPKRVAPRRALLVREQAHFRSSRTCVPPEIDVFFNTLTHLSALYSSCWCCTI